MVTDSSTASPTPLPNLLDAAGAAKALGVQTRYVRRLAEIGELPPVALYYGATRLFLAEDVAELVAKRAAPPAKKPGTPEPPPRLPGDRWAQRHCTECGGLYSPRGPNDPRCSDEYRAAHREKRETAP